MRDRILVDFWNPQLAWNSFRPRQARGLPHMPWKVTLTDVVTVHMGHESDYTGSRVTLANRSPQPTPLALIEMRLEFVELAMRWTDMCYICDA